MYCIDLHETRNCLTASFVHCE